MFLNSFNYFRGIAILCIVAGHTYWVARWNTDQTWERFIANLITGGTLLFVFISGFLFHHVFYPRFQYGSFLKKKVQNVWVPYLILSSLPILYILMKQFGPFDYYYFNKGPGLWNQYFKPALLYVWTGNAVPPFWYIPFIMITFLMSPLHKKYIEAAWKTQTLVLLVLIAVSMLLHRPVQNLSPLHAVGYYSSGYFLGIYCSIYREHIYRILKGKEWVLLIFITGLAAFQAWKFPHISLFAKPAFKWGFPDIQYLQKVILCFFFMVFLHRFENVRITVLNKVAEASFAIYFLHSFIIESTGMAIRKNGLTFSGNMFTWIIFTVAVVYVTYIAAWLVKRSIRNGKSRYIIGW
jgi:probable poly-beta-1,6-N-acetyl-D-glucosamine export protein